MPKGSDLDRVAAVVLREMRGPMFLLLVVYSVGIIGIVLIPGADGSHMGIFHGFYFMTYTATTTGFGELPSEFSEAQRMWAIACLYMSVVAWIYSIGAIVRLVQNPYFTQALAQRRFANRVRRLSEPFIIICGFGDTGSLLTRGLSDRGMAGVVIDTDQDRIKALMLRNYDATMIGLQADASVPKNLIDAGLPRPNCTAVVVLTDEAFSLKIAVMTRLLNPAAKIVCRTTSLGHVEEMRSLGAVIVSDPFEAFARELSLALHSPSLYTLDEWLVGAHGASLERPLVCPTGTWVLCGYGRMGKHLFKALSSRGVQVSVIDPHIESASEVTDKIVGHATKDNLDRAGVRNAAGVVAATNDDTDNLGILINARALNPDLFLVVRQNNHENEVAFTAANANLIMQPSLVSARRILMTLVSPLIQAFLDDLEAHPEVLMERVYPALRAIFDNEAPLVWVVRITPETAPAVVRQLAHSSVSLGDVLRDPTNRDATIRCAALLLARGEQHTVMPAAESMLRPGDEVLMCGVERSRQVLDATLSNPYTLHYLLTGVDPPHSSIGYWLRRSSTVAAKAG